MVSDDITYIHTCTLKWVPILIRDGIKEITFLIKLTKFVYKYHQHKVEINVTNFNNIKASTIV